MALIMPGVVRGAKVVHAVDAEAKTILEKELDERAGPVAAEWPIESEPELGPPGPARGESEPDA